MTFRCFIALPVPEEIARHLARLHRSVPHEAGRITWVKAGAIHLTCVFLGAVEEELIDPVRSALEEAAAGIEPFETDLDGVGAFPRFDRPRVVWVALGKGAGEAVLLKKRIDRALEPLGFEPDRKRYYPHITLGRVRSQGRRGALERAAAEWILPYEHWMSREVVLYRSELTREGPIYTSLARVSLAGKR